MEVSNRKSQIPRGRHGNQPKITRFALGKCGWSTSFALARIKGELKKSVSQNNRNNNKDLWCGFAGNKDKHAVSVQWCTVSGRLTPSQLHDAVSHITGIKIGSIESVKDHIRLGQLKGNRFQIVLRDVKVPVIPKGDSNDVSSNEMEKRLKILQETGFLNYFGMQRFGSSTVGTHDIGRAILQNKFDLACALMILPRSGETGQWKEDRMEFVQNGDIHRIPKGLQLERKLMFNLRDDESPNFEGAMLKMDRKSRML